MASRPGRQARLEPFPSELVTPRAVTIWTPYPAPGPWSVIYAHDGQNLFDPQTAYLGVDWGMDECLSDLIHRSRVRPTMVVGVWNTPHRLDEYMPTRALPRKRRPRGEAYLRFLVEELKPYVDATYPTRPGPADTILLGSSMGGLASLHGVCEYPEIFGAAACLSTHWPALGGVAVNYVETHLPEPGSARFYFDLGTETTDAEYEPYQTRVDGLLAARGYRPGEDWTTRRFPGDDHSERSWRRRLHEPLEFLLRPERAGEGR